MYSEPWANLPIHHDDTMMDASSINKAASVVALQDIIQLLVTPDTHSPIVYQSDELVSADGQQFQMDGKRPVLLPKAVSDRIYKPATPLSPSTIHTALDQYLYFSQIKNSQGDANTIATDQWYRRHLHRSRTLLQDAAGLVLDVGCDDPQLSRLLFRDTVKYVGIEPSLNEPDHFRIIGMAEFLPFRDQAFDCVSFLTSLDHVMDYHRAMDEAIRVLKPGGRLFLASLMWTSCAELYRDTIHFHHFREFELRGALGGLLITDVRRYDWKGDMHRSGVYINATKPAIL